MGQRLLQKDCAAVHDVWNCGATIAAIVNLATLDEALRALAVAEQLIRLKYAGNNQPSSVHFLDGFERGDLEDDLN